jgi:hypothetical protein
MRRCKIDHPSTGLQKSLTGCFAISIPASKFISIRCASRVNHSQPFIVNTVYFSESIRREFCSTSYGGTLYTEHIPLKLSEIKDIPSPDNLYILLSALDGFSTLYARIGFFNVEECMICINKQGKARVWVSDDLSRITPDAVEILFHGT